MFDQRDPTQRHLSSFHLKAIRLGAAAPADADWAASHLEACAACTALAAELLGSRREFAEVVAPRTRAALRRRVERVRPRWLAWLGAGLLIPAAAAGVALVVSSSSPRAPMLGSAEPELSVKGGPMLLLAARRGDRIFPVRPGEKLRA